MASAPRLAGVKVQRFTAATAARSSRGKPLLVASATSSGWPGGHVHAQLHGAGFAFFYGQGRVGRQGLFR